MVFSSCLARFPKVPGVQKILDIWDDRGTPGHFANFAKMVVIFFFFFFFFFYKLKKSFARSSFSLLLRRAARAEVWSAEKLKYANTRKMCILFLDRSMRASKVKSGRAGWVQPAQPAPKRVCVDMRWKVKKCNFGK